VAADDRMVALASPVPVFARDRLRRGEVLALRRENVDDACAVVIVAEPLAESRGIVRRKATKSEHIREIPLSSLALKALQMAKRACSQARC
jgi:integrase